MNTSLAKLYGWIRTTYVNFKVLDNAILNYVRLIEVRNNREELWKRYPDS